MANSNQENDSQPRCEPPMATYHPHGRNHICVKLCVAAHASRNCWTTQSAWGFLVTLECRILRRSSVRRLVRFPGTALAESRFSDAGDSPLDARASASQSEVPDHLASPRPMPSAPPVTTIVRAAFD